MNTSKLNYLLVFALVALFSFSAAAQDYTFKVISKKGTAQVGGEELKVGSKIQAGQSIAVGAGTLLNIAHSNGKSLNISKEGIYKVDELAKGCTAEGNSLASKYADFVLKELTSGDDSGVRGRNMRKPGSVERSLDGEAEASLLFMVAESKTVVAPSAVTLYCAANAGEKVKVVVDESEITTYTFVISDLMKTELARIESDKPEVTIDMTDERFANVPGNTIEYYAFVNGNERAASIRYALELVQGATAQEITQSIEELSADDSALGKLILARYLEEQGYHANASYAYQEAVKLSGNDDRYVEVYQAFLDRNYGKKKTGNQ